MQQATLSIPTQISQAVRRVEPQAEIILFGSRARGSARPDSDWDVLILLDGKVTLAREQMLFGSLSKVELATEEVFSILTYEKALLARSTKEHPTSSECCPGRRGTNMKEDLIHYRLQKAQESYEAARLMSDNKQWNFCVNRLYYTCFYAVIALLLKNDITPRTHDGTKRQFGLHFVKTGKIKEAYNDLYSQLFSWRQKGDYGDMFDFTEEDVKPLFQPVQEFLTTIEHHIRTSDQ